MISETNIKEIPGKKISTLEKISFMVYNAEKNLTPLCVRGIRKFYDQKFEKKFLNKQNRPYRAQSLNLSSGALVLPDVNF